ncbi:MAG: YqgE/AlgH family protein [Acidimicrobiales bacterium]
MPRPGLSGGAGGPDGPGRDSEPDLSGKLLVAAPVMADPNFARTVVLVLHHDSGGSLGLVLNRPSQLDLGEPLRQWVGLAAAPAVVFVGGPVASAAAICLGRLRAPAPPAPTSGTIPEPSPLEQLAFDRPQGWRPVLADIGTLDLNGDPSAAAASVSTVRVFAGYAGWGPGQLTSELGLGGWMVADPSEEDAFSTDPGGLWKSVLRRQSPEVAILAGYPEDPSAN